MPTGMKRLTFLALLLPALAAAPAQAGSPGRHGSDGRENAGGQTGRHGRAVPGGGQAEFFDAASYTSSGASHRNTQRCAVFGAGTQCLAVLIDHSRRLKIRKPFASIIVGNPAIADASAMSNNLLIVHGRTVGATNIILLDADGEEIVSYEVYVREPTSRQVTVRRGMSRETYLCAPYCTRSFSLGDSSEMSRAIAENIGARSDIEKDAIDRQDGTDPGLEP